MQAEPVPTAFTKQPPKTATPIKVSTTLDVPVKPKASAQSVRDYFAASIGTPVTRQDLLGYFGRDNERTVDQEVSRLVSTGAIARSGVGRYTMPRSPGKTNAAQH